MLFLSCSIIFRAMPSIWNVGVIYVALQSCVTSVTAEGECMKETTIVS